MNYLKHIVNGLFRIIFKIKIFRNFLLLKAFHNELRNSLLNRFIPQINYMFSKIPEYHNEFSMIMKCKNYSHAFWASDLGLKWYEGNHNRLSNEYFEFAIMRCNVEKYSSHLDIGCGWGDLSYKLSELTQIQSSLGIDVSSVIIEKARELYGNVSILRFEKMEIKEIKAEYDLITMFGSTDYILPNEITDVITKLLTITKKELLIVQSLRDIGFDRFLGLNESIEVLRYDRGYVHPLKLLIENQKAKSKFTYSIKKISSDSVILQVVMGSV